MKMRNPAIIAACFLLAAAASNGATVQHDHHEDAHRGLRHLLQPPNLSIPPTTGNNDRNALNYCGLLYILIQAQANAQGFTCTCDASNEELVVVECQKEAPQCDAVKTNATDTLCYRQHFTMSGSKASITTNTNKTYAFKACAEYDETQAPEKLKGRDICYHYDLLWELGKWITLSRCEVTFEKEIDVPVPVCQCSMCELGKLGPYPVWGLGLDCQEDFGVELVECVALTNDNLAIIPKIASVPNEPDSPGGSTPTTPAAPTAPTTPTTPANVPEVTDVPAETKPAIPTKAPDSGGDNGTYCTFMFLLIQAQATSQGFTCTCDASDQDDVIIDCQKDTLQCDAVKTNVTDTVCYQQHFTIASSKGNIDNDNDKTYAFEACAEYDETQAPEILKGRDICFHYELLWEYGKWITLSRCEVTFEKDVDVPESVCQCSMCYLGNFGPFPIWGLGLDCQEAFEIELFACVALAHDNLAVIPKIQSIPAAPSKTEPPENTLPDVPSTPPDDGADYCSFHLYLESIDGDVQELDCTCDLGEKGWQHSCETKLPQCDAFNAYGVDELCQDVSFTTTISIDWKAGVTTFIFEICSEYSYPQSAPDFLEGSELCIQYKALLAADLKVSIEECTGTFTDAEGNQEEWSCSVCEVDGQPGYALESSASEFEFPECQVVTNVLRATRPTILVDDGTPPKDESKDSMDSPTLEPTETKDASHDPGSHHSGDDFCDVELLLEDVTGKVQEVDCSCESVESSTWKHTCVAKSPQCDAFHAFDVDKICHDDSFTASILASPGVTIFTYYVCAEYAYSNAPEFLEGCQLCLEYEVSFRAASLSSELNSCVGKMTDAEGNEEEWACTACEIDGKPGFALVSPVKEYSFPECQPVNNVMRATFPEMLVGSSNESSEDLARREDVSSVSKDAGLSNMFVIALASAFLLAA